MLKMQARIEYKPTLDEIPRAQGRIMTQPLAEFEQRYDRNEGMARAYLSGQHTMAAIAGYFEVHYSTVSRAVKDYENKMKWIILHCKTDTSFLSAYCGCVKSA